MSLRKPRILFVEDHEDTRDLISFGLKQSHYEVSTAPILFYSGAAFENDRKLALSSGAQAYLIKPVETSELLQALKTLTVKEEIRFKVNRSERKQDRITRSISGGRTNLNP